MTALARDPHPEPEVLAAFVDGTLEGAELVRLSDHLRACAECRMIAGEAARFESESNTRSPRTVWWWSAAAAVAASTIFAVFVSLRFRDPLRDLQPQTTRPYAGRFTSLRYAPLRITRSAESQRDYRRLAAAAHLQDRVAKKRTPENLHRFAVAEAVLGRSHEATALLQEAAAARPQDAEILADLAAAQLSGGDSNAATVTSERALRIDPHSSVAAFNLALSLETRNERDAAIDAWRRFLELDQSSPWAEEARARLARLNAASGGSE